MPATLSDEKARLAAEAVDWYVREGVPDAHVRAIALGEITDERFEQMKSLRAELRELVLEKAVIGRHALDYLRSIPWDDPAVTTVLERITNGKTRVTVRAPREVMALFAEALRTHAEALVEDADVNGSGRLESKRLAAAGRQLAAKAT